MCLKHRTTERDPRQESPLGAQMGEAVEKDWPKRPSSHQLQEAGKRLCQDRNICSGGSPCPCSLGSTNVRANQAAAPPSCSTLTGAEPPQAQKSCVYARGVTSVVSDPCDPVDCGLPGFSVRGFSRHYWSALANTGCHTLLEHCISCCPSRQPP